MDKDNFSFTQLFKKFRVFGYGYNYGNLKHPFMFQQKHLNEISESLGPNDIYQIYLKIKEAEKDSFCLVEIETSLLFSYNHQIKYINQCLDILIKLHNRKNDSEKYLYFRQFELYPIVQNSIKNLILSISHNYAYLLDPYNRDYYLTLVKIQAPILSFKLIKPVRDEHFYRLFHDYIVKGGFVAAQEETQFKSFFEGRRMEKKINWLGAKNTLCYFIKLLRKFDALQSHSYSHWEVTAEFFIIKGRPLLAKQLINQGKPANRVKVNTLENFVGLLL